MPGIEELYPMGVEAARKASDQFADQEMMADIQNKLPEDARFSGLYGLLPWLGYSRPPADQENPDNEYRARIANTAGGIPGNRYVSSDRGKEMGISLGAYLPERPEKPIRPSSLKPWNDLLIEAGSPELGSGDIVFNQLGSDYLDKLGLTKMQGAPERIIPHELTHRATDKTIPMIQDLLSYVESSEEFDAQEKEFIAQAITGHGANEALSRAMDNQMTKPGATPSLSLRLVDKAMRNFLTPQKQEQYGVRIPTPAAKPQDLGPTRGLDRFFR
jgi:hypothetical protein